VVTRLGVEPAGKHPREQHLARREVLPECSPPGGQQISAEWFLRTRVEAHQRDCGGALPGVEVRDRPGQVDPW